MKLVSFVVALVLGGACNKANPNYCPGNPDNNCLLDGATGDGPHGCMTQADCAVGVCDTGLKQCVACTTTMPAACTGPTPVCTDDKCVPCVAHTDCPSSNVCLPTGACGDASLIAYVSSMGTDNATCTMATPCTKVLSALATTHAIIKITGTIDEAVTINNRNVTMLADPGAVLTSSTNGNILVVNGSSNVKIYDLSINGASGPGAGVSLPSGATQTLTLTRVSMSTNNGTSGAILASGGTLSLQQSKIINNSGGGISLTATQFDLENNFIAKNGGAATAYGGVFLSQTNTGTRIFNFNTVTANQGASATVTGLSCAAITQPLTLANNIVYGNLTAQVGGTNCAWTYSDIGPDTVTATGNINMEPMFVSASTNDFHIMSSSPAKDAADPAATLAIDIDGDVRPQGPARDMGADEYK